MKFKRDLETTDLKVINQPVRLIAGFPREIVSIWNQRELLTALASREFRVRYKGARLGWLWALMKPLVMLLIYALAVGVFLGAGRVTPEFAVYLYVGLITWGLFAQIVLGSIYGIIGNSDLIRKAAFPRELIILAVVFVALIDLLLQLCILPIGYLYYGSFPKLQSVLWMLPSLMLVVLFGMATGLLLAAMNSRYRDIGFLSDIGLQVGFWLVPVIYPFAAVSDSLSRFPFAASLILENPISTALFGMRKALWPPASMATGEKFTFTGVLETRFILWLALGALFVFFTHRFFVRRASNMAEEL